MHIEPMKFGLLLFRLWARYHDKIVVAMTALMCVIGHQKGQAKDRVEENEEFGP